MIGNNIFKDIFIILWARRKANAFRVQKMPKNIFELFEMFIDFQELVLRFLVSQTIFYPLNPPETYLVWQISKNQCLWRSQLEKLLRKKNHGEKSVQKLEKSVTLPSGSRFYKIFWSTFWSSLRIIWEFLILQDIVVRTRKTRWQ